MIVLRLFGTPELRTASDTKAHSVLAQAKHVAFLAVTAAARRSSVRRDRVVGLLWPELDEDRARNALSKAIHNCRRALGEDALVGRFAEEVGLDVARWSVDLWDFEDAIGRGAHEEALSLYGRGEFMEGFHIPDASALEHWIDGERDRLRRRAIDAATTLADNAERAGDAVSAAEHLRLVSDLSPFDERILRRRLAMLDRSGDRAGAIGACTEFAERMQRELDASPSPETIAMIEAIRQRATVPAGVAPDGNGVAAPSSSPTTSTPVRSQSPEPSIPSTVRGPSRAFRQRALAIGVGALGLVAMFAVVNKAPDRGSMPGSVVVTPFVNQVGDSTLTYFGEMVADQLGYALTMAGVADVADSRTRARQGLSMASAGFVADQEQLAALARETGATTIVTGNYYRSGDSLVVYAAIRGVDGRNEPVRSIREVGLLSDRTNVLSRLEQQLLGAVASLRDPRMTAATSTGTRIPTYAAYAEYVSGLRASLKEDYATSAVHFERAYELDSNFVAIIHVLHYALSLSGRAARADSILEALGDRRAQLAPFDQAQLDWTNGLNRGDREAMYEASRRMTQLAPRSPDAQWYLGFSAATTNRYEEAVEAFSRVDLKHGWTYESTFRTLNFHTTALHLLGRYRDELALVRATRAKHPSDSIACFFEAEAMAALAPLEELTRTMAGCFTRAGVLDSVRMANARVNVAEELRAHDRADDAVRLAEPAVEWHRRKARATPDSLKWAILLGTGLLQVGAWEEALAVWEPMARSRSNNEPPRFAANAAIAAAHLGKTALAEEMLARLTSPKGLFHFQRARILAHLDRKDEAIAELLKAVAKGIAPADLFHANLGLDPLRGRPEYEAFFQPRR